MSNPRRPVRLLRMAVLAAVYVGTARLGLAIHPVSGVATTVWPPTGIALAALLLFGEDLWPAVAVGALAVNLLVGAPVAAAATFAVGNTLEAVIGAALLRRAGFRPALARIEDVAALIGLAALLSTAVSATFGVLGLKLGGLPGDAWLVWRVWWVGDAMGDLLVAPLLLLAASRRLSWRPRRAAEGALLFAGQVGIALLVLRRAHGLPTYLLFPLLLAGVVRFGQPAAVIGTVTTAAIAISSTWLGAGPFVQQVPIESFVHLEGFLGVLSITLLILGAAVEERLAMLRSRQQIMAIVSHDLGNALGALQLRTHRLEKRVAADDESRHDVQVVRQSVRRMARLISDLVDAVTIQTGRLGVTLQPLDPARLLDDAAEARPSEPEVTVTVEARFSGPPPAVACDRDRLLQVFTNLMTNAARAMGQGGRIALSAAREGSTVVFSVSDSGPGIQAEDLPLIFEPYRRGRSATYEGLGLGLAISKAIVEAHGGRLWVESRPGAGATFRFTVPIATVPIAPEERSRSRRARPIQE